MTARFGQLHERRAEIEAKFGAGLTWEPLDGNHDEYIGWFLTSLERLRAALDPYA